VFLADPCYARRAHILRRHADPIKRVSEKLHYKSMNNQEAIKQALDHCMTVDVEFKWRQNAKASRERIAEKYGPKLPVKLQRRKTGRLRLAKAA
jgi:hypothetical protein